MLQRCHPFSVELHQIRQDHYRHHLSIARDSGSEFRSQTRLTIACAPVPPAADSRPVTASTSAAREDRSGRSGWDPDPRLFRRGGIWAGACPVTGDISGVSPRIELIFSWKALNPLFGAQDEGFSEFRST